MTELYAKKVRDLSTRAISAFAWRFGGSVAQAVMQLVVIAVLSRLLEPSDFGLLAAALVLVGFATLIGDLGTTQAVVQCPTLSTGQVRAAFYVALTTAVLMSVVVLAAAAEIASILGKPNAATLIRPLSLVIVLSSLGSVSTGLLLRDLDLKALVTARVASYVFGYATVSISLAIAGYGVWALVWGGLAQSGGRSLAMFLLAPHSIMPRFHREDLRQTFRFGMGMTLTKIAHYVAGQGDYVIVSRNFGDASLGLYSRAFHLMNLCVTHIAGAFQTVSFAAMSEIQTDLTKLAAAHQRLVSLMFIVFGPLSMFIIVLSPQLVALILGPGWEGSIVPLQILSLGMVFRSASKISDALIRARGSVYRAFLVAAASAVLVIVGSMYCSQWGISGVAAAVTITAILRFVAVTQLATRIVGADWKPLILRLGPATAISGAALIPGILAARATPDESPEIVTLTLITFVMACGLVAAVVTLPKRWLGEETTWLLRRVAQSSPYLRRIVLRLDRHE